MRPSLNYLNPFVNDSDPQHIIVGAPNLRSERAYNFTFSYQHRIFKKKLQIRPGVNIQYIDRAVERYTFVSDENSPTTTYRNLGHRVNYRASLMATYTGSRRLRLSESFAHQWNMFEDSEAETRTNRSYYNILSVDITPWEGGFISGSMSVRSQLKEAQDRSASTNYSYSLEVSQAIVKNRLFLTMQIIEPFRNRSFVTTHTTGNGFSTRSVQQITGRSFSFAIRWSFGRLKEQVREAGEGISNDDLTRE